MLKRLFSHYGRSEQHVVVRDIFGDWRRHPGRVVHVLIGDVFGSHIAAPCAAAKGEGEGHSVNPVAAVSVTYGLSYHYAGGEGALCQLEDMILVKAMNAAGMAFTFKLMDFVYKVDRFVKGLLLEYREDDGELFIGERMLRSDAVFFNLRNLDPAGRFIPASAAMTSGAWAVSLVLR